jgi:hypothetical protein
LPPFRQRERPTCFCIPEHVDYKADGRRPGRGFVDTRNGGFVAQLGEKAEKDILKSVGVGLGNQPIKAVAATLALGCIVKPVQSG